MIMGVVDLDMNAELNRVRERERKTNIYRYE